jgi:hypothetical protein
MAATQPRGGQILDGSIQRVDLDVSTVGQAVIRKVIQGTGISMTATGADAGTGDVTINATGMGDLVMGGRVCPDPLTDANGDYITSS